MAITLAALKHGELARELASNGEAFDDREVDAIRRDAGVPPWQKNPDRLAPAAEALTGESRGRFDEELQWAEQGLWSAAAGVFEALSGGPAAAAPPPIWGFAGSGSPTPTARPPRCAGQSCQWALSGGGRSRSPLPDDRYPSSRRPR